MSPELVGEIKPLLEMHWESIAHYKDIPLDPDFGMYDAIQAAGALRIFTARVERNVDTTQGSGRLIGYCVFFVRPNGHYRSSIQASQDILFLHPEFRGGFVGYRFIEWCDDQLREEGVQVVYQHVKQAHNFGPLLERMGYRLVDLIYGKRLDGGE